MTTAEATRPSCCGPCATGTKYKCNDWELQLYKRPDLSHLADVKSAGVSSDLSEWNVSKLLKQPEEPPLTETVQRFQDYYTPGLGLRRVHHGQAKDPELLRALEMTHGVTSVEGEGAKASVNPSPLTRHQQRVLEHNEALYDSAKKKPLGRAPNPNLPEEIDPLTTTFGVKSKKDIGARELLNPPRTFGEVYKQEMSDHDTYLMSHRHFYPGEQAQRQYNLGGYQRDKVYGMPTPCFPDGRFVKQSLHWLADQKAEKCTPIVAKRFEDFRERTHPQLGKVLDPIADTMHVPPDHTFGIISENDPNAVAQILSGQVPRHYVRGDDKQRGLVGAARQHLRAIGFYHLRDLREILAHLDSNNEGHLPRSVVRRVFNEVNVPLDHELLEQLFDLFGDKLNDRVYWRDLLSCLDWKNRIDLNQLPIRCRSAEADDEITPRRVRPKVNQALLDWCTASSAYNAGHGCDTKRLPAFGAPSLRGDLPRPKERSITDKINYGDESGVHSLINPSILTQYGISELDMKLPRSKEEMRTILSRTEICLDSCNFDALWEKAVSLSPHGQVCMDSFKPLLYAKLAEMVRLQTASAANFT